MPASPTKVGTGRLEAGINDDPHHQPSSPQPSLLRHDALLSFHHCATNIRRGYYKSLRSKFALFSFAFLHQFRDKNMRLGPTPKYFQFPRILHSNSTGLSGFIVGSPYQLRLLSPRRQRPPLRSQTFRKFGTSSRLQVVKPFLLADIGEGSSIYLIHWIL